MMKKTQTKNCITTSEVEHYELLSPMLDALLKEVKELSKKKQDEPLNKLKVKVVNRILEQINKLLSNEPTIQFMDLLDDETLPTNSDAVLMLAQFRSAMDIFRGKYYGWDGSEHRWFTNDRPKQ